MTPRQVDEMLELLAALLRNTETIARHLKDDDPGVGLRVVPDPGDPQDQPVALHAAPGNGQ